MLNIIILSKSHLKKLKEYKLALILTIAVVFTSFSQNPVGIGTVAPHPSAILEVSSTDKGFLPPHMSEEQMRDINSPAGGLIVYCTGCNPSFVISPTLIPSGATVDYELIRKPTDVTISRTRINNIPSNIPLGEYNITVKARGNGDYSGETGATFKLNVVLPPPNRESCFGFSRRTGTITNYTCSYIDVVIPVRIGRVAVTHIGNHAFWNKNLTSVYIPNSVTSIGYAAFYNNNLSSVTLPDSMRNIGESAFRENNLSSIYIPDSVRSIGNSAFQENNLSSIYIPDSVRSIRDSAFQHNPLRSVSIKSGTIYTAFGEESSFDSSCTVASGCITIRP